MKKEQRKSINIGSWRLQDGEQKGQWREQPQVVEEEDVRERTPKKIAISHYHRICKPWIILPYGMYYNAELLTAKEGDILLFSDRIEREIEYLTPIKANTSYTNFLCKKTYQTSFARLRERWKANLEFEGYNIKAVNEDRVMLIYLKEIPSQEEKPKRKYERGTK